jgi:hypothetical protein
MRSSASSRRRQPALKQPLLTLLKTARAFGLGVVLTTQNPVDLDYKGLTNAGTWFIGKLQTERDKLRVLDGLESATSAAGSTLDRQTLDRTISALGSRVFLLHNVHQDRPVIFQTRWAMSYLRGPLTRTQVRQLMAGVRLEAAAPTPARPGVQREVMPAAAPSPAVAAKAPAGYSSTAPTLPPDVPQVFLPVQLSSSRALARLEEESGQRLQVEETTLIYEPCLLALGSVSFVDHKLRISEERRVGFLVQPRDLGAVIRWQNAEPVTLEAKDLEGQPEPDALFGPVPSQLNTAAELKSFSRDFGDYLYREQALNLYYNPTLKLYGQPGESERDFKARAQQLAREQRDEEVEKLRQKYRSKLDRLQDRLAREQRELEEDRAEYEARKREELLSAGETVVSMLGIFGRRRPTTAISRAATKRRLTSTAKADIEESEAEIARLQAEIEDMRRDMEEEAQAISDRWNSAVEQIETYAVKPSRSDVRVDLVALAWAPYWEIGYRSATGSLTHARVPAWSSK